jgi:hypothetical protein
MTATIPRATGKRASAADIAQRTAVLFIERRTLGLTRRVRQSEVIDAEAHKLDLAWLGVSKHLLHRKVLREVNRLDGDMREYLESRSSPCSMLAKGMWLFSLALVKGVSPEDLREKGLARDRVRAGFENITAKLAKLDVVPAKQRRVILDEAGA